MTSDALTNIHDVELAVKRAETFIADFDALDDGELKDGIIHYLITINEYPPHLRPTP